MEYDMMNILYAALPMSAQTEKTTFACKDNCTLRKHTLRWTYSARDFEIPLCHTPPLRSFFLQYFFILHVCSKSFKKISAFFNVIFVNILIFCGYFINIQGFTFIYLGHVFRFVTDTFTQFFTCCQTPG